MDYRVSISGGDSDFFSSPPLTDRVWVPPIALSKG